MKLYVLPLGSCKTDKEKVFTPGKDEGVWIEAPIWASLIQVESLNILIDTGMHPIHIKVPQATFAGTPYAEWIHPLMREEDIVVNQLGQLGLTPEDIDFVVNTHLHFDHAGGNCAFSKSIFLVQKEHYQHALTMQETFPPRYFLLPDLTYELIEGEMTLVPRVEILRSPGHVVGMQTVVVRLPETGTIVLASDAIPLKENMREDRWRSTWNPKMARASARRLQAIAEAEEGQLFFGHDPEWWKGVKVSPDYYS